MRNLHVLRNINLQDPQLVNATKYCIVNVNEFCDFKSTRIQCFTFFSDLKVYLLNIVNNVVEDSRFIADLTEDIKEPENITIVEYTHLFDHLYVILSDGQFVLILLGDGDVEIKTGNLNINVKYVSWSPDITRTAIVDDKDELHVLNIQFDSFKVLSKTSLQTELEEQNKFINVGWGSIETQFRGSEGKYSKSKLDEVIVEEAHHDSTVHICWKQNSTAFAITYSSGNSRKVKIFNQDGALLNVSKNIVGLFSPVDWCSSRNLITTVQKLPNKKVICFLEQNALKHGDFQIRNEVEVIRLRWNNNGSILALHGRDDVGEFIALWTTSNYKWYQKQKLVFRNRVSYLQWDFDVANRLHVILETGIYRMYEWSFRVVECSRCKSDANPCLVAVINDKCLNLTPYRKACQPPSMPHATSYTPEAINAVIFPTSLKLPSKIAILYLSDNKCIIVKDEKTIEDVYCFNFGEADTEIELETPIEMSAWLWLLPNELYFNWSRVDGNYFCFSLLDRQTSSIVVKDMIKLNSIILAITNYESDVIVHTEDGALYIYQDKQLLPLSFTLLEPCFQIDAMNYETLIALSEHRNLYVNDSIKWRNVLCFYWKPPFLVVMKMGGQMLITKVDFRDGNVKFNEVQTRNIETKSYLVTIVDDQVLLEMERGNLETIRPRPFSVFSMEQMLSDGKYFEVFKMLRKQRINLNVIFDHNPMKFLSNLASIVNNVPDPMYLSTFITELVDENVAKSMFPWKYEHSHELENKVHMICEALVSCIEQNNTKKFINPLIAALVRQGKLTEAAKYAVEYNEIASLSHLADPISVYRAALASFDMTCALRIVEHSKLDPSEYLPFIRELQATEETYRKFKICDYLEKYDEALKYIAECEDKLDECVAYIRKHNLYSIVLDVFSSKNKSTKVVDVNYRQVLMVVADFYFSNKMYDKAGLFYEKANANEKALECYLKEGDCFSAVTTFMAMDSEMSEIQVYTTLYETLRKQGRHMDAASIAFDYLKNCEKAVDSYLTAKEYCRALNAAKVMRNQHITEETIHSRLLIDAKSTIEHLQSSVKVFQEHAQTLHLVREKKRKKDILDQNDGESSESSFSSTATSESTGSVSSLGSKASMSSSAKRLRRRERRLWNLKRGNPREEPSLVACVREMFITADTLFPKLISDMCKALIKTDEVILARELKSEYSAFVKLVLRTRNEIWSAENVTEEGGFKDILIRCPPDLSCSENELKLLL